MSNSTSNQKRYFFLIGGVFINPTAIEIQACIRAKLFKKYFGINPTIITHGYESNLRTNFAIHNRNDSLLNDTALFSIFDFYCDKSKPAEKNNDQSLQWQPNFRYEVDRTELHSYWAFLGNQLQMYIEYHPHTRLIKYINYVDHTESGINIIKRDFYDDQGYLAQVGVVDPISKNEQVKYLLDREGRQRLIIHYRIENNEQEITKIFVCNEHGMVTNVFNSKEELVADFLQQLADKYPDDEFYFIVEHPIYYQGLRKIKHPNAHTISIFHNLQTTEPDVKNSAFHGHFADPLAEYKTNPSIKTIVLSEAQKQDIEQRLCPANNLYVIPNTFDYQPAPTTFEDRDRFLLTALVRLSPQKQVDKMIQAFALVKQVVPQAKLDIYGVGELQGELQQLIDALNLSESVKLKGFTQEPYQVFSKAGLALLTSHYEGLPLVIMESLVSGCPFISFDVKYGPSAMIKDGENGYLIPPNDLETMAQKIIYLLQNPTIHEQMCHNAYYGKKDFDMPAVAEKWQQLFADIEQQKA